MKKLALALAATVVASALPMEAHAAVVTIATSSAIGTAKNVRFVNSGNSPTRTTNATFFSTSNGNTAGSVLTKFSFLQPALAQYVTNVTAAFTLNGIIAKGSNAISAGGFLIQPGASGTFSFISTSAITVLGPTFVPHTYAAGSNLLSGTFSSAAFFGASTATSGGVSDSVSSSGLGSVVYTSDFLDFSHSTNEDLLFPLTAITAALSQGTGANKSLNSFRATIGGQFSTDPAAVINGLAVVPEPATWAMMIGGFGLIGTSLRARRKATLVAA